MQSRLLNVSNTDMVEIPKKITSYCAGDGMPFDDGIETELVPLSAIRGVKNPYLLQVFGDSMEKTIMQGDKVILDAGVDCRNGDIVAVHINDMLYIKRLRINFFTVWLDSDNPEYKPIKETLDIQSAIFGKVVRLMRDL